MFLQKVPHRFPVSPFFSVIMACLTTASNLTIDNKYPGMSVERLTNARARIKSLHPTDLSGEWEDVRQKLLWAAGLKNLKNAQPGYGYTGHSFNDWNHVDATCMLGAVAYEENKGLVEGIAYGNQLGHGIKIASIEELGRGGSWSTCMMGCNKEPPQDVAHLQFKSRIAFKLVWAAPSFSQFVIVDDDGDLLNWGLPKGRVPDMRERKANWLHVKDSKYGRHAKERDLSATTSTPASGSSVPPHNEL